MCFLCPLSFPHRDIHKSPYVPYNTHPADTIKHEWFEALCLIPGQWLLFTTAAKCDFLFPQWFSPLCSCSWSQLFPPSQALHMSLDLLLLLDLADINHISGEGQQEQS